MRRVLLPIFFFLLITPKGTAQVAEMNWELDYQVYMKMANDSNYTYDIRQLFHITNLESTNFSSEYIFYPVNPGVDYVNELSDKVADSIAYKSLWGALHAKLGGGWIHFTNCIAYALETQKLDLLEPIMKRPQTDWKPDPVTETWKRTRNWEYYVPMSQKSAISEFKTRKSEKQLGDLQNIPASYIELFLATNDKKYLQYKTENKLNELAKIDLVKIILAANYLGEDQISFISNSVLNAVKSYTANNLPSVLVFDAFDAAAAMSLDEKGYKVESIVFKSSAELSEGEMEAYRGKIFEIIEKINTYNQQSFKKRLGTYYKN